MTEKTYHDLFSFSIKAAAALVKQRFVGFDGNYCGADKKAAGVSLFAVNNGEEGTVIFEGIALVEAGGVIAVSDPVKSDAVGKALKANALAAALNAGGATDNDTITLSGSEVPAVINGYAMDASSADGDIIRVKLV